MPTIIADAGPLIALIDAADEHHRWAVRAVRPLPPPWITFSSALAEVTHHFANDRRALVALRRLGSGMSFEEPSPDTVLGLMERYAPTMDYADACAVLLAKAHTGSMVVTTDHRDFSVHRVPFVSPRGEFHP